MVCQTQNTYLFLLYTDFKVNAKTAGGRGEHHWSWTMNSDVTSSLASVALASVTQCNLSFSISFVCLSEKSVFLVFICLNLDSTTDLTIEVERTAPWKCTSTRPGLFFRGLSEFAAAPRLCYWLARQLKIRSIDCLISFILFVCTPLTYKRSQTASFTEKAS